MRPLVRPRLFARRSSSESRTLVHRLYKKKRLDVADRDQVGSEGKVQAGIEDGDRADSEDEVQVGNEDSDRSESEDEDEDEPPVLWSLSVYDAANTRYSNRERPYAIYESDKPLEISGSPKPKQTSITPAVAPQVSFPPQPTWRGCIFEVSGDAAVRVPSTSTGHATCKRWPEAIEALDLETMFQRCISIRSPFLCRTLKAVAKYYPEFFYHTRTNAWDDEMEVRPLDDTSSLKFYEPWGFLLHRFLELKAQNDTPKMQSLQDDKGVEDPGKAIQRLEQEHLRHLIEFLEPYYHSRVVPCKEALEKQNPRLPFNMLWYAFAPGSDVYFQENEVVSVCVVIAIESNLARSPRDLTTPQKTEGWNLDMWYLDSDGQHISRSKIRHFIPTYTGVKAITSLSVCPATIWDTHDRGERRKRILERSKLVFESIQKGHLLANYDGLILGSNKHYSGTIVLDQKRGMSNMQASPPDFFGIIDHSTQFENYDFMKVNTVGMEEGDAAPATSTDDSDDEDVDSTRAVYSAPVTNKRATAKIPYVSSLTSSLTEHQLLLLCPRTRAFALKTKQWLEIDPNSIQELTRSVQSIENLVLGESELKTIKGLARRQNSKRATWAADFVEGKGTGQIILLHGPPGVGKTYTVEAVAQYLHRPLVALTIADIGTVETRVERELITWFTLAEAWHAVLLVDEADIFLERRQNRDLARNGLVSAFLRRMEYFSGLLFLTTNRVGQIDDAFISRVHVAIGYNALTPEDRHKIWQGFFRKLAKERAGKIQISQGAKKWVLEKAKSGGAQLNGRDIRNALQTAITLAEAEHEEDPDFDDEKMPVVVDQSHFQRVLDITNKFQSYVESIKREDEKKRAANRYDRNDYYKSEAKREDREMLDL